MKLSTKGLDRNRPKYSLIPGHCEHLQQSLIPGHYEQHLQIPIAKSVDNPLGVSVWHLMTIFKEESEKYYYTESHTIDEEKTGCNPVKCVRKTVNAFFRNFSNATVNDIENLRKSTGFIRQKGENVVCKEDNKLGESYVNCLSGKDNVGPSTHMLSYSWGNKIDHIISSLYSYCCTNYLDPKRTYIWICCLCINQHRVKEMMERGEDVPFDEFGNVFEERVMKIGNVLALMVPWKKPIYLTRVWCIFEIYTALIKECNLSIIMPEEEKDNLMEAIKNMANEPDFLWKALALTRIENATASVQADKDNILKLIETGAGYADINDKVNARLREWIDDTIVEMVKKAEDDSNDIKDLSSLYSNVGLVYNNNGKYDVAIDYYKKSLTIDRNVYGEEHQLTAAAYANIGNAYTFKGKYDDALDYLMKAHSIYKTTSGVKHTAISCNQIGVCYMRKEEFDIAIECYEKCLFIKKKIYGEMHQSTAVTLNNMALCYGLKGEKNVAIEKHFECLRIKKKILDKGHPKIAATYYNIGCLYYDMNKVTDAEKYVKMAIDIQVKVLGPDHPHTLLSKGWHEGILAELENK